MSKVVKTTTVETVQDGKKKEDAEDPKPQKPQIEDDAEFIEALEAEQDENPKRPARTDVLYSPGKRKWITLTGASFPGFATINDVSERWPKAYGSFRLVYIYYKGGALQRNTKDRDLNYPTSDGPTLIAIAKMKEMFPGVPFPDDPAETPSENETHPQARVVYMHPQNADRVFHQGQPDEFWEEFGPDGEPSRRFYFLDDVLDDKEEPTGQKQKTYFEDVPYNELTPEQQRLMIQGHGTTFTLAPQPPARENLNADELNNPQYLTLKLYEIANSHAEVAQQEAREERKAMRDMMFELSKAVAQNTSGGGGKGISIRDVLDVLDFAQGYGARNAAPAKKDPLDRAGELLDRVGSFLDKGLRARNNGQAQVLQQIRDQQAKNPGGGTT